MLRQRMWKLVSHIIMPVGDSSIVGFSVCAISPALKDVTVGLC